jgi:hypothetical protein
VIGGRGGGKRGGGVDLRRRVGERRAATLSGALRLAAPTREHRQ